MLAMDRRAPVLLLSLAALGAGCNDVLGIGVPELAQSSTGIDTGGTGGSAGASSGAITGGSGGGGAGAAGSGGSGGSGGATTSNTEPPCRTLEKLIISKEDAHLPQGACNGSISGGNSPFMNVGIGPGIFRFVLPAEVQTAFSQDKVYGLELTLARAPECGDGPPCNVKAPGEFEARPLRNDWVEGNGSSYSGVDYCRRLPGTPAKEWAAPGAIGAADADGVSGTVAFVNGNNTITVSLDPALHKARIGAGQDGQQSLSVRLWYPSGGAGTFVAVAHESGDLNAAPRLTVTYCE